MSEQFNPNYSEGDLWTTDNSTQTYGGSYGGASSSANSGWSTGSSYSTGSNSNNPGYATSGYEADLESMASSNP